MRVDNSILTGESEALLRTQECTAPNNPLETTNLCFMETVCTQGAGTGIVISTGNHTVLAAISALMDRSSQEESYQKGSSLAKTLKGAKLKGFISILIFQCSLLFFAYGFFTSLLLAILVFAAELTPEMILNLFFGMHRAVSAVLEKNFLIKRISVIEKLAAATAICTEKTGILTQNRMTVSHLWYDQELRKGHNRQKMGLNFKYEYDIEVKGFRDLHEAAILSTDAIFDTFGGNSTQGLWLEKPTIGSASEVGIIKFFQPIEDIQITRTKYPTVRMNDGSNASIPFNSVAKYALKILKYPTNDSDHCIFIMGAPDRIKSMCSHRLINGEKLLIDEEWRNEFDKILTIIGEKGERALGFAKYHLPRKDYPQHFQYNCRSPHEVNFPLNQLAFCGVITLADPPRDGCTSAITECKKNGIKVIMVSGDHPVTATAIARELGLIGEDVETADQIAEKENIPLEKAMQQSEAIVIHGSLFNQVTTNDENLPLGERGRVLAGWLSKPQVVFARMSPSQKLAIVEGCQRLGHTVIVTGSGAGDSPAVKKADVGVGLGIAGSDICKEAADAILSDDNFATIVEVVKISRRITGSVLIAAAICGISSLPQLIFLIVATTIGVPLSNNVILFLTLNLGRSISRSGLLSNRHRNQSPHLGNNSECNSGLSRGYLHLWNGTFQVLSVLACYLFAENVKGLSQKVDNKASEQYRAESMKYAQVGSLLGVLAVQAAILIFDNIKMNSSFNLKNKRTLYEFILTLLVVFWILMGKESISNVHMLIRLGFPSITLGFLKLALDELIQNFYLKR